MDLSQKRIVIIGGTAGIGLATAQAAVKRGAKVVVTGLKVHQIEKQERANKEYFQLDIADENAVKKFFDNIGEFDYLTTPGSSTPKGAFLSMDSTTARTGFESKFWGQYNAAKYAVPHIRPDGAIVFFAGVISERPQPNLAIMAAVNSAIEGLGRVLAVELAPIRINVISPGFVDTPRYAVLPEADRNKMFANIAKKLPLGRVGKAEELAEAVLFLMTNTFTTGTALYVDGGHRLS